MLYNKKKWYAAEALHETDKYKCSVTPGIWFHIVHTV